MKNRVKQKRRATPRSTSEHAMRIIKIQHHSLVRSCRRAHKRSRGRGAAGCANRCSRWSDCTCRHSRFPQIAPKSTICLCRKIFRNSRRFSATLSLCVCVFFFFFAFRPFFRDTKNKTIQIQNTNCTKAHNRKSSFQRRSRRRRIASRS